MPDAAMGPQASSPIDRTGTAGALAKEHSHERAHSTPSGAPARCLSASEEAMPCAQDDDTPTAASASAFAAAAKRSDGRTDRILYQPTIMGSSAEGRDASGAKVINCHLCLFQSTVWELMSVDSDVLP